MIQYNLREWRRFQTRFLEDCPPHETTFVGFVARVIHPSPPKKPPHLSASQRQ